MGNFPLLVLLALLGYGWSQSNPKKFWYVENDRLREVSELVGAIKKKNSCRNINHYSSPTHTCCNGKEYDAGISFNNRFSTCLQNKAKREVISVSMWNFYKCLVRDHSDLQEFAKKMSSKLPNSIKGEILERVKDMKVAVDDAKKPYDVRAIYHDIERGICNKSYSDPDLTKLQSCKDAGDFARENLHSRGDCCGSKVIPVPLELFRRPPTLSIRKCTKTLMYNLPQRPMYYMDVDFEKSDAQQLCQTACALQELKIIPEKENLKPKIQMNEEYEPETSFIFNATAALEKLMGFLATETQEKIIGKLNFPPPENFTLEITDNIYDLVENIRVAEFWENVTRYEIEPTLVQCESYNQVVMKLETALYEACAEEK